MKHKKEHHGKHHLSHEEEMKGGHESHMHHHKMAMHHLKELHKMAKHGHKHKSKAARMDESLGMRRGKESSKSQSMMARRHESKAAKGK
jgi:hypothetical protein